MGTHVRERQTYVRSFVLVEQGSLRQRIEAAIESMLALLDEIDTDPDLEPDNDDEASLGWREGRAGAGCCPNILDDGEDCEDDEDSDAEEDPAEAGVCDGSEAIEQRPAFIGGVRL